MTEQALKNLEAMRFKLLKAVYDETGGSRQYYLDPAELGQGLGYEKQPLRDITQYLIDEGLLEIYAEQGHVRITHEGIKEVEAAIKNPDAKMSFFPMITFNNITIDQMNNSTIQQGSGVLNQQVSFLSNSQLSTLESLMSQLKASVPKIKDKSLAQEVQSEIATIKAQIDSPKPKKTILQGALNSLRQIAESAAGSALGSGITQTIVKILEGL